MLSDNLYKVAVSSMGSEEHLQIAGLIKSAAKIVVDETAAASVRNKLDRDPWEIECNLDVVSTSDVPEWIEWPMTTRAGHGGGAGSVTGCLVAPNPDNRGIMTFITGWSVDDMPARHSYAVALVDVEHMYELAWNARRKFSRTPEESIERIMSCVSVSMPRGFEDEIRLVTDEAPGAVEAAMRDATAEIPYALALAVAIGSRGWVDLSPSSGDGYMQASLAAPLKRGLLSGAAKRLKGTNSRGFDRKVVDGKAVVTWYP